MALRARMWVGNETRFYKSNPTVNFPLGVDVGALSARIASLKGEPRGRHPYRRPLGWRLRQGYHTDFPTQTPRQKIYCFRVKPMASVSELN